MKLFRKFVETVAGEAPPAPPAPPAPSPRRAPIRAASSAAYSKGMLSYFLHGFSDISIYFQFISMRFCRFPMMSMMSIHIPYSNDQVSPQNDAQTAQIRGAFSSEG